MMEIEWNSSKAAANQQKHGISFDEAATVLLDPMALAMEDTDAESKNRWIIVGMSTQTKLLTVVYTVRIANTIRIISAHKATRREAKNYAR